MDFNDIGEAMVNCGMKLIACRAKNMEFTVNGTQMGNFGGKITIITTNYMEFTVGGTKMGNLRMNRIIIMANKLKNKTSGNVFFVSVKHNDGITQRSSSASLPGIGPWP